MPFREDNDDDLAIAFLHRTYMGTRQVMIREVKLEEREMSSEATKIDIRDDGANRVIPVLPTQAGGGGGLLLCGGSELLFFESKQEQRSPTKSRRTSTLGQRRPDAQIDWPHSDITGYAFVPTN